jgi:hypothetical protein
LILNCIFDSSEVTPKRSIVEEYKKNVGALGNFEDLRHRRGRRDAARHPAPEQPAAHVREVAAFTYSKRPRPQYLETLFIAPGVSGF